MRLSLPCCQALLQYQSLAEVEEAAVKKFIEVETMKLLGFAAGSTGLNWDSYFEVVVTEA